MKTFLTLFVAALSLSAEPSATCTGCNDFGPIANAPGWSMSYGSRMVWTVTIDPGVYRVELTFVEPIYTTLGQRPLNVTVNDVPFLKAFDVVAAGGPFTPVTQTTFVTVSGQSIIIVLTANSTMVAGKLTPHSAILSGLKVRPIFDLE